MEHKYQAISTYNATDKPSYDNYSKVEKQEENTVTFRQTNTTNASETVGSIKESSNERKGYFAGLQLKESINMEEPKKVETKRAEVKSLLDKQVKPSLKESINLTGSGEFTFDF